MRINAPRLFSALLLAFALSATLAIAVEFTGRTKSASAQSDGAGGSGPRIQCSWILQDADSSMAGMQYGQDADPMRQPDAPCAIPAGSGTLPSQNPTSRNVIQVGPVLPGLPGETAVVEDRIVQSWAAVGHASDTGLVESVTWSVFNPDGTLKTQLQGTKVDPLDSGDGPLGNDDSVDLNDLGMPGNTGTMFDSAHATGQLSADAISASDLGLVDLANRGQRDLWFAQWSAGSGQICGEHLVQVTAMADGVEAMMNTTIEFQCSYNLEVDVSKVLWGAIGAVGKKTIPGNLNFIPEDSSKATTLRYSGSHPVGIGIQFGKMFEIDSDGVKIPGGLELETFGFGFGVDRADLEWFDPIPADEIGWVTRDEFICAETQQVTRADLSVVGHPDRSSFYTSQIYFLMRNTVGCGLGDGSSADADTAGAESQDV